MGTSGQWLQDRRRGSECRGLDGILWLGSISWAALILEKFSVFFLYAAMAGGCVSKCVCMFLERRGCQKFRVLGRGIGAHVIRNSDDQAGEFITALPLA